MNIRRRSWLLPAASLFLLAGILIGTAATFINTTAPKIIGQWFPREKTTQFMSMVLAVANLSMALGIGIDATIHMITSWISDKNLTLRQLMDTTGRNVMASSTTTIAGFVGFLFTTHRGLKGIGDLACLSIAMFLVTSVIFTMYLCGTWLKKK